MIIDSDMIEVRALEDMHKAATQDISRSLDLLVERSNRKFVSIAARLSASAVFINRCFEFTGRRGDCAPVIADIIGSFHLAGRPHFLLHSDNPGLVHPALVAAAPWQRFMRSTNPIPSRRPGGIHVKEVSSLYAQEFARTACCGNGLGTAAEPWLAALVGRVNWHLFLGFDAGEIVGCGAAYIDGGMAWLGFDTILPGFEGGDGERALFMASTETALDLGCKNLYSCRQVSPSGKLENRLHPLLDVGFSVQGARYNYTLKKR